MDENDLRPAQRSPLIQRTPMASPPAHARPGKPDARPMRLAIFAGGIAVSSALAAAIIRPARPAVVVPAVDAQPETPVATGTPIVVQQPIQYIQLLPGQTAPPGATVIDPDAPKPTAIVATVQAPAARPPARKPIIIRTTQSGKVIP